MSGQGFTSSIDHAEALSTQIKDIRDELAILRSVAKYQENVQKELFDGRKKTSNMSSTYVLDDLGEMDEVSKRVQAAVRQSLCAHMTHQFLAVLMVEIISGEHDTVTTAKRDDRHAEQDALGLLSRDYPICKSRCNGVSFF